MSKYLKWYDSYLDHTPTEDLAKNELESAHRKIKQLTESLAKANEDYKALFSAFQNCHDELVDANELVNELEALAEERAEFIINASNMASANEVYKRCKFPLKVAINKFAIEKTIEELDLIVELAHSRKGGISTIDIANRAHELSKQLRKEQENV